MIGRFIQYLKDRYRWGGISLGSRSPQWGSFKKNYEKTYPKICAICGNKKCSLHHKQSFATHPELELSMENVCWLCDGWGTLQHHRGVGHLGDFRSISENINEDIIIWKKKFDTRPKWNGQEWIYRA